MAKNKDNYNNIDIEIERIVKSAGDKLESWDDVPTVSEDEEYKTKRNKNRPE